jgi:hypothetical protein
MREISMKRSRLLVLGVACVAVPIALSACKRAETPPSPPPAIAPAPAPAPPPAPAPFRVSSVDVGNAIGADKRVTVPSATLAPGDTIYASVSSTGTAPSVTLVARWTYGDGQLVNEQSQQIAPTGPSSSEFHISKPDGWPAGSYKVEILADGTSVASKNFEVK